MRRLIVTIAIVLGGCATGVEPESGSHASGGSSGTRGGTGGSNSGDDSGPSGAAGAASGGSAGSAATGGSASGGDSGSTSSGGSSGSSGGTAGSGGSSAGGSSGAGSSGTMWTFDNDLQGWVVAYSEPGTLAAATRATWDSAVGDPRVGSAALVIPFTAVSQKLDFSIALSNLNLSGKTLSARVRLDSGLSGDASNPGGAKLYVKSGGGYSYADGGWNNLDSSKGWVTLTLNVSSPGGFVQNPAQYSASDIREVGIEFATGSAGSSYTTGHIHVDSVGQ